MKGYGDLCIVNLAGCWGFAMMMFHGLFFKFPFPLSGQSNAYLQD